MKGQKQFNINGKNVTFKLTVGATEDFQDWLESKGEAVDLGMALSKMRNVRQFLSIMSGYGGDPVDAEAFKAMEISEFNDVMKLFDEIGGKRTGT